MTILKRILVALAICMYIYGPECELAAQTVASSEIRMTAKSAPSPLANSYRLFVDTADGTFKCVKPNGSNCIAATTSISIGTTTTGAAGTSASVSNGGTSTAPVLNFTIPQGSAGATGPQGPGFNYRGAWTAATQYNPTDIVTNAGSTFEADHAFISGSTFGTGTLETWNTWAAAGATGATGPAGGLVSFSATSWPSWLTPTVTNSTSTPNLAVSASTIPLSAGGTNATTQQGALNSLTGTQSSGKYVRSDGTNSSLASIVAADVPTLNQNTTGKATANVMNWSGGPYAGTIPATAGQIPIRTNVPGAITIISYTMHLVTAGLGCSTQPTYQLQDLTSSTVISTITLANSTTDYSNTGLSTAFTSGHDIGVKVGTSSGGCSTSPANGMWTVWYTM